MGSKLQAKAAEAEKRAAFYAKHAGASRADRSMATRAANAAKKARALADAEAAGENVR